MSVEVFKVQLLKNQSFWSDLLIKIPSGKKCIIYVFCLEIKIDILKIAT